MARQAWFAIVLGLLVFGCKKQATAPLGDQTAVVQGTVAYFAGGGTREMPYPAGFVLLSPSWIRQIPENAPGRIYLRPPVDSTLVGKQVRVEGTAQIVVNTGLNAAYTYSWTELTVSSVQIIP